MTYLLDYSGHRLRNQMGTYYMNLRDFSTDIQYTVPYYDITLGTNKTWIVFKLYDMLLNIYIYILMHCTGSGLFFTMSVACYHGNQLIGVVANDISLLELFQQLPYFDHGKYSYAFLIDNQGNVNINWSSLQKSSHLDEE